MTDLNKKAWSGLLFLMAILAIAIFFTAGTINYWQGWAFLVTFTLACIAITIYLMRKDPELLQRRIEAGPAAEKEKSQKTIQAYSSISFIAVLILPVVDHRLGWSAVASGFNIAGDIFVATGFYFVFLVFKENTYTSSIIEVADGQKVISLGPYALVRHPMYSGALVLLAGVSPALGSWWGLLAVIPFIFVLSWRLLDEEKFLEKNLAGYPDYQNKVKYRLLPGIW